MTRRFRPTDAFVDESIRGQRYLMAYVLVEAHDMAAMRSDMVALAGAKSTRVHFNAELDSRRQLLLETFATFAIESFVVVCRRSYGVTEFEARNRCLAYIVHALQLRSIDRLVVESRQDDRDDERTIHRHRQREPRLVFEHRRGNDEPLLWIADGVAWAVGAGSRWSDLLGTNLGQVTEVSKAQNPAPQPKGWQPGPLPTVLTVGSPSMRPHDAIRKRNCGEPSARGRTRSQAEPRLRHW